MFDPWDKLHSTPQIRLHWVLMPDDAAGRTDGISRIWMDRRLEPAERRCTLTHELIHIERGHTCQPSPGAEASVRRETALRLIPFESLLAASRWARHPSELAEDLSVTETVARDRLTAMTPDERARLAAHLAEN